MIAISDRQYDDHCTVVFYGELWWITAARWPVLALTGAAGKCTLDLSSVDWESYDDAALRLLREAFPEAFDDR